MKLVYLCAVLLSSISLGGCAASNVQVQKIPIDVATGPSSKVPVPVYTEVDRCPRSAIPFMNMAASGNGYATRETLTADLALRAAKLGADCIYIADPVTNQGGSITTYGSGVAFSQPMYFLSVQATACVFSRVRMGVVFDNDHKALDVVPGGPAARAGMRIGDRVLAINGKRVTSDRLAIYREMAAANPGTAVAIEVVGPDNGTRVLSVVWEANT